MRLRAVRFCTGFRFERLRSSGIFDLHEVADLPQHTGELRALLVLRSASDLAQPEGAERAAMPLGLADLAADLGDLELRLRHQDFFLERGLSSPSLTASSAFSPTVSAASETVSTASSATSTACSTMLSCSSVAAGAAAAGSDAGTAAAASGSAAAVSGCAAASGSPAAVSGFAVTSGSGAAVSGCAPASGSAACSSSSV